MRVIEIIAMFESVARVSLTTRSKIMGGLRPQSTALRLLNLNVLR